MDVSRSSEYRLAETANLIDAAYAHYDTKPMEAYVMTKIKNPAMAQQFMDMMAGPIDGVRADLLVAADLLTKEEAKKFNEDYYGTGEETEPSDGSSDEGGNPTA